MSASISGSQRGAKTDGAQADVERAIFETEPKGRGDAIALPHSAAAFLAISARRSGVMPSARFSPPAWPNSAVARPRMMVWKSPQRIGTSFRLWALKVEGSAASGFFHQDGIKPQYIGTRSLPAAATRITSIGVVGAMLKRGARLRGGPMRSARRWISAHERFCVKRPRMGGGIHRLLADSRAGDSRNFRLAWIDGTRQARNRLCVRLGASMSHTVAGRFHAAQINVGICVGILNTELFFSI